MGANYDVIIAPVDPNRDLQRRIEEFLAHRGLCVVSVSDLRAADRDHESVILLSPEVNGYVEVVANNFSLGIPLPEWFQENALASALSDTGPSVHLWTLDSGFVAGYSVFESCNRVEGDVAFSQHAKSTDRLMNGVATPTRRRGRRLRALIGSQQFEFPTSMQRGCSLETELGKLVAQFGFEVHLVDFLEAVDDHEGIAIQHGEYKSIQLTDWRAIQFRAS